ncbi:MAG TPA: hypothetical protein VMB70_11810, partial [Terriglobia bacterium]|nr:hypothetical protein [Terriglobia bacterium]
MRRRTRILIASASILLLVGMAVSQQDNGAEAKLRAAMDKETIDGDLKGAIEQYRKLAQGKDRSVAARALVRMGGAYEKLGDSESRRIYETVTREFADQKEALAAAQSRLAGKSSGTLTKRLLHGDCARPDGDLSVDARGVVMPGFDDGIFICDTLTGQLNPILPKDDSSDAFAETPVLSPDQRQIVYTWDLAEKDRNPELRIMANQPHSRPRVVVKSSPDYDWFDVDGWFPDGESVLVTIRNADMTYQLAKIAIDSGRVTPLKSLGWRLRNSRAR